MPDVITYFLHHTLPYKTLDIVFYQYGGPAGITGGSMADFRKNERFLRKTRFFLKQVAGNMPSGRRKLL